MTDDSYHLTRPEFKLLVYALEVLFDAESVARFVGLKRAGFRFFFMPNG